MSTYLAHFFIATGISLVLTPIIRRLCERWGWLDRPLDGRRVHLKPVPRLGGVAIFVSVLLTLAIASFRDGLSADALKANGSSLFIIFVPAALVFLFGVYDDVRRADARLKFAIQLGAGALFYVMGGRIEALSVPFAGTVELPSVIGFAATLLWIVGISNAFNLIDGIDGLAAGAALFASLVMLVVSLKLSNLPIIIITLTLSGALIGFLRYNFNPASIFLGDSGSLFIGFILAALSVKGAQKASTAIAVAIPLMAFGVPIIDTGFTLLRRFLSGRPLFQGDREHIHHMLLARGWSQRRVVFVLYGVCALFGLLALLFVNDTVGHTTGLMLCVISVAVVIAVGRLRYHEADEVKASVKRNLDLVERRQRAVNNIQVRRAIHAMSKAASLGALFGAVREILDLGEFAFANVQLSLHSSAELNRQVLAAEKRLLAVEGMEVCGDLIRWSWERGDMVAADVLNSSRFWRLSFPLSTSEGERGYINLYREFNSKALLIDLNYLCTLFHREMAQAIERVLTGPEEVNAHELAVSAMGGD